MFNNIHVQYYWYLQHLNEDIVTMPKVKAANAQYECTECGKAFVSATEQKIHELSHIKRKCDCPICPANFHEASKLATHLSKHDKQDLVLLFPSWPKHKRLSGWIIRPCHITGEWISAPQNSFHFLCVSTTRKKKGNRITQCEIF